MRATFIVLVMCAAARKANTSQFRQATSNDVLAWLKEHAAARKANTMQFRTGMRLFMTENVVEKLQRVDELLQTVAQRQALYYFCTPDPCGEHGTCSVMEPSGEHVCLCEKYWLGPFCNVSNPCFRELYDMQFEPVLLGRETPRCTDDGFYKGMQYSGSMAHCVTKTGVSLGYEVNRWQTGDMPCDCARDEYENHHKSAPYYNRDHPYHCTENGGYTQFS